MRVSRTEAHDEVHGDGLPSRQIHDDGLPNVDDPAVMAEQIAKLRPWTPPASAASSVPPAAPLADEPAWDLPMKCHPAAQVFPLMDDAELTRLADDIKANGLQEMPWRISVEGEWQVLDGRNRIRALALLGRGPSFRDYMGSDPMGFVLSLNLRRRHMSPSQLALIAAKAEPVFAAQAEARSLMNLRVGPDRANLPTREPEGRARDQAAEVVGVSGRSVQAAKQVLAKATPEVVAMVEKGEMSVSMAAKTIAPPARKPTVVDRDSNTGWDKKALQTLKEVWTRTSFAERAAFLDWAKERAA